VLDRIQQPYLIMHGKHDAVMPWQEAQQRAGLARRGEFHLFENGNTACHSVSHLLRPLLADWMATRLV
jgi:pimeloyl-ACP methyl ester carboxylesterase